MKRILLPLFAALLLAPALFSQKVAPADGDLIPRAGTLAYMLSDRPEALLHLFGRDAGGKWRLRAFFEKKLEEEFAERLDSDEAREARSIVEYIFNSYDSISRTEVGLLDVTVEGPKFVIVLHVKQGRRIDASPAFLAKHVLETREFHGIKYQEYRLGPDATETPKKPEDGDEGPRRGDEAPRPAVPSIERMYVASMPGGGVLMANFESSIRESIQRLATGDYSESFSGRAEFKEWKQNHKPHDLSVFIVGRELQNAIERVLPDKDQAGMDAKGVYRGVDDWLQLREYRYIVFDLDYDESARAFTVAASFKTRRQTRLLEKLAIEPADFKLLKFVPGSAVLTVGMQLGDARKTYTNLKELAYDVERWADEVMKGFGGSREFPDVNPPDDVEPKSVLPGGLSDLIKLANQEDEDEPESQVDRALGELEKMLGEFGTTLDSVLGVLGTEVIFCLTPELERAKAAVYGTPGMNHVLGNGNLGIIIALKDVNAAKKIIATAREKDPRGAFRGFEELGYQGRALMVSSEHPFGWCFTDDALVLNVALGLKEDDATKHVLAGLTAMVDASRKTGGATFVSNSSKFIEVDVGALSRIEEQLAMHQAEKLDRYAQPPLEKSPTRYMDSLTVAVRLKEYKDGVELALRVGGLPDVWQFIDGDAGLFEGNPRRNAYSYSEENMRQLAAAMRQQADDGKPVTLDALIEAKLIRRGTLQVPFDARWKGDIKKIGWITLDQVQRDKDGNLPEWVNKEAAEMIEANEAAGWSSFKLVEGDVAATVKAYRTGFIVAYQEKPDSLDGHIVLYADGQVGWLSANAFKQALKLNAEDKPVPALESWREEGPHTTPRKPKEPEGERLPPDDPWAPGGK